MPTAKLSSKSQIVIPAEVRRRLGLQPGDTLDVRVEGNQIVMIKESPLAALERLRALAGTMSVSIAEEVERSRAEWETRSAEIERLFSRQR